MQLESGEYFLKKSEKEARENAKRREKVTYAVCPDFIWTLLTYAYSKQKLQKNDVQNGQKFSLRQQKHQHRRWKRKEVGKEKRLRRMEKRGRRKRRKRRKYLRQRHKYSA